MDEDSNGNSKEVSGTNNRQTEQDRDCEAANVTEREGGPDTNFRKEKKEREKREGGSNFTFFS